METASASLERAINPADYYLGAMIPLLLLHGALGGADQMQPLKDALEKRRQVYSMDFSGHGKCNAPGPAFSIPLFASDVLQFMDSHQIETADIFGYSMGGYVALYLARHHPRRVQSIITLGTKFFWDEAYAASQAKMLDAEKIADKVPKFAAALEARHGTAWKNILIKTSEMMIGLGQQRALSNEEMEDLPHNILAVSGDRDNTLSTHETAGLYLQKLNRGLAILPNTGHPIEKVNLPVLCLLIENFLQESQPLPLRTE